MAETIRRVVTGHDNNGAAIIAMDGEAQNVRVRARPPPGQRVDNSGDIDRPRNRRRPTTPW